MKRLVLILLLLPSLVYGANEGPNLPTAASQEGGGQWVNVNNILGEDDNSCATHANKASKNMYASDFDFTTMDDGATIEGYVFVAHGAEAMDLANECQAQLVTGIGVTPGLEGNPQDLNLVFVESATCSDAVDAQVGGVSDTWGATLTGADVKDAGFGVAIWNARGDAGEILIDHGELTIYFTNPVAGGQVINVRMGD